MMATKEEQKDIQQLKTDVALIRQEQKNQRQQNQDNHADIVKRMNAFSFVAQKDYDRDLSDQADINKRHSDRLTELEKLVNAGGLKIVNTLSSNITKMILAILAFAALVAIVTFAASVFPAIGGVR